MSEDKGGEYTKRLTQELKSSLYQRDPEHQMWNGDMAPPDLQVSGLHSNKFMPRGIIFCLSSIFISFSLLFILVLHDILFL